MRREWRALVVLAAMGAAGAFVLVLARPQLAAPGAAGWVVLELTPGAGITGGVRPGPAHAVAVVAHPSKSLSVPVVITNPSDRAVRYPWAHGELDLLAGLLYRDGERVSGRVGCERVAPTADQVRELKPGESVATSFVLPYVQVRPGMYELRLEYRVYPGSVEDSELRLTPMILEHVIRLNVQGS